MKKGQILLTGGAGYIGSHVNKLLSEKGYQTIIFDNLSRGHAELVKWGKLLEGCLSNTSTLDNLFKHNNISCVMHFAAYAYVGESIEKPGDYYANNVSNTINLLNVMIANKVNNIIFSSTCATYGIPDTLPITENTEQKPINPYGRGKLMIETILRDYTKAYGLNHINLRYFNAAGCDPECEIGEIHQPETHLIPRVIEAALYNKSFTIYGNDYETKDGTCVRDFVHVNDLASAHFRAMKYLKKYNISDSFNIGTGSGYTIKEVIDCVEKILNKKINVIYSERRDGDPAELFSNNDKAISKLEWHPNYNDLGDIIKTAADWFIKLNNHK
jgi:UDP-glucose 4-epimerase